VFDEDLGERAKVHGLKELVSDVTRSPFDQGVHIERVKIFPILEKVVQGFLVDLVAGLPIASVVGCGLFYHGRASSFRCTVGGSCGCSCRCSCGGSFLGLPLSCPGWVPVERCARGKRRKERVGRQYLENTIISEENERTGMSAAEDTQCTQQAPSTTPRSTFGLGSVIVIQLVATNTPLVFRYKRSI
jgi:hypothetical protein